MGQQRYTPTQQRILNVLADGMPHLRIELLGCLHDELGDRTNLYPHLSRLRTLLRPQGQDIVCELQRRRVAYRWVRLLRRD